MQLFPRTSNFVGRAVLVCAVFAGVSVPAVLGGFVQTSYSTGVGREIVQPVPFSHKHHVQGLGLDCKFCHTTTTRSDSAGMPDTWTCMGCHSQIWTDAAPLAPVRESLRENRPIAWQGVHSLPEHVYFSHRAHVGKGLQCTTCHGDVANMALEVQVHPFRMKDCVHCHENPERGGVSSETISNNHIHPIRLTECSVCHR